jgi:hypothetical protein
MAPSVVPALALVSVLTFFPSPERPIKRVAGQPIVRTVDLGAPGALDRIASENPRHYRQLRKILAASSQIECDEMPGRLYVSFGAVGNCTAPNTLLTSFPAKRRVSVALDDTNYVANVEIRTEAGRLIPAH